MVREDAEQLPQTITERTWAMLRHADPDAAAKVGQYLLKDEKGRLNRLIHRQLQPLDAVEAYLAYWMLLLEGNPEQARQALQDCAEAGVPMPKIGGQ